MKLVTFEYPGSAAVPGIRLDDGAVLDLPRAMRIAAGQGVAGAAAAMPASASMLALIGAGAAMLPLLRELAAHAGEPAYEAARVPQARARLLAPIPRPAKNVFCVGRNYLDHVKEGYSAQKLEIKIPEHVQFFSKPPTTVIGPGADIRYDQSLTQKLDYEVELGVVLGTGGRDIPADRALDHVFGYTVINDVTARDLQRRHDQWFKGKGLDTTCPMGPWIVTADEIADPQNLAISLRVNGQVRQDANTSMMIFKLPRIIADLSRGLTLEAGDVIATGTPSGVGYAMEPPGLLAPGDVVECAIEAVGQLTNTVRAA